MHRDRTPLASGWRVPTRRDSSSAAPRRLGGAGLRLSEIGELQQRFAYHAPAMAIAINMHLYWTGIGADLQRFVDDR